MQKPYHPYEQRQDRRAFNKTQKQPQSTCQAKMVAASSMRPYAALLVPSVAPCTHNGPSCIYMVSKILSVKADMAICSPAIDVSG